MPSIILALCVGFIIYKYLHSIIEWTIIIGLAYGFYRFIRAVAAPQNTQAYRPYVSPTPHFRPEVRSSFDDEPLDDLDDNEPPSNTVIEEVYEAFKNDTAREVGRDGEERVDLILRRTALDHLSDVYLEDEQGLTQIDHIAKMPWGLVVIETKTYGGFISGTRNPRRWKQSFRHVGSDKYYLFQNPRHQNDRHVSAVRHVTGLNDHVFSLVVFAGSARTSRSVHDQIVRIRNLRTAIRQRPAANYISDWKRDDAWERLKRNAAANRGREAEHLASVKQMGF